MLKELFIHVCIVITFLFIGGMMLRRFSIHNTTRHQLLLGMFSGIIGSFLMEFSIHLTPTIIMDFRHIAILLSALYGGGLAAFVSVMVICVCRVLFFSGSAISLLVSDFMMVCIGSFAVFISRLHLSELKKWVFVYVFSLVTLTLGFLYLLGISKGFFELMVEYWAISILAGALIFYCANFINQSNRLFNEMKIDSTTDYLTGLHNVRYFNTSLNLSIKKAMDYSEKLSFLMIDIDHFKMVNDTFGHIAGDDILRKLGELLTGSARSFDIVSRIGGEEFSILLLNCHHAEALEIAERIRRTVENYTFVLSDGRETNITISVGVSTYLETTDYPEQLVGQADTALYKAKRMGRNNVCSAML